MKFNAVCKQCRRAGTKLFLKGEKCFSPKCPMVKRKYPPGVHGPKGIPRISEYGLQLQEKQKTKRIYGLNESQFKKYYLKALKKKGQTGEELIRLLESRLDNVVFRLGLASSRRQARQIVSHGHIKVNKRVVNIPSYQVKKGDLIAIKEESKKKTFFVNLVKIIDQKKPPSWLKLDTKKLTAEVISYPTSKELEHLEFYSK